MIVTRKDARNLLTGQVVHKRSIGSLQSQILYPPVMAYDRLAESLALIEGGNEGLRPVFRLSRRRRFVPMAVDVADDFAATMFLRRSVAHAEVEVWQFARRQDEWCLLGGSGRSADPDEDLLADRPALIPPTMHNPWVTLPDLDPSIVVGGDHSGGTLDSGLFPWRERWISHMVIFASQRVSSVRFDGRTISVPWHGRTLLTWVGHKTPKISAYDSAGERLGTSRIVSR